MSSIITQYVVVAMVILVIHLKAATLNVSTIVCNMLVQITASAIIDSRLCFNSN